MDIVHREMKVFDTHFIKDYFKDNKSEAIKLSDDNDYYKMIRFLIAECDELLNNKEFLGNIKEVIKYTNQFRVLWTNRKIIKLIIKKG